MSIAQLSAPLNGPCIIQVFWQNISNNLNLHPTIHFNYQEHDSSCQSRSCITKVKGYVNLAEKSMSMINIQNYLSSFFLQDIIKVKKLFIFYSLKVNNCLDIENSRAGFIQIESFLTWNITKSFSNS